MSKSRYLVVSSKRNTYPNRLAARGGMDREVKGTGKGGAKYCSSFSRPLLLLQGSSQKFRQLAYTSASGNAPGRALRTAHALFRPRPLRGYNVVLSHHSKITPVPHRSRRRFFVLGRLINKVERRRSSARERDTADIASDEIWRAK